jgi:hypothetical protein
MKSGVFWVVTPCGSCKNQEPHGVTTQKTPFFINERVHKLRFIFHSKGSEVNTT